MEKRRKLVEEIVSGADEFEVLELDALRSITGGCSSSGVMNLNCGCGVESASTAHTRNELGDL